MSRQMDIENLLRMKARGRVGRLQYCLAKLEAKIAQKPGAKADQYTKAYYKYRKPDWENLCQQYRDELAEIELGNYHGYNGKPFGATPGIS